MPKFVPIELVIEIVSFVKFHQKWARIRVSHNFDFDLLKRMAKWLMNRKKIIEECRAAIAEINSSINELPPRKMANAYKRLYQLIADIVSSPSLEYIGAAHENAAALKARVEQLLDHCFGHQSAETIGRVTHVILAMNSGIRAWL